MSGEILYNSAGSIRTMTLDAICLRILENGNNLKDEDIEILYDLFGDVFMRALEIIEKGNVDLITILGTERAYFSVQGTSGIYTVYQHINFCPCPMFRYSVVKKNEDIMCKHVLASHLAWCLNKYNSRTTPELVYTM